MPEETLRRTDELLGIRGLTLGEGHEVRHLSGRMKGGSSALIKRSGDQMPVIDEPTGLDPQAGHTRLEGSETHTAEGEGHSLTTHCMGGHTLSVHVENGIILGLSPTELSKYVSPQCCGAQGQDQTPWRSCHLIETTRTA